MNDLGGLQSHNGNYVHKIKMTTLLGVPSCVRFCQQEFVEFPRLVGRYCSYLLPKQAGGTPQILVDKTSAMSGRLRVYMMVVVTVALHLFRQTMSTAFEA